MLIAVIILSVLLLICVCDSIVSTWQRVAAEKKCTELTRLAGHYLPSDPRLIAEMEKVHGKAGVAAIRDYLKRRGMMVIHEGKLR